MVNLQRNQMFEWMEEMNDEQTNKRQKFHYFHYFDLGYLCQNSISVIRDLPYTSRIVWTLLKLSFRMWVRIVLMLTVRMRSNGSSFFGTLTFVLSVAGFILPAFSSAFVNEFIFFSVNCSIHASNGNYAKKHTIISWVD